MRLTMNGFRSVGIDTKLWQALLMKEDEEGDTAIFSAIKDNNELHVRILLELASRSNNLNMKLSDTNQQNVSVLQCAINQKNHDLSGLLIEQYVDWFEAKMNNLKRKDENGNRDNDIKSLQDAIKDVVEVALSQPILIKSLAEKGITNRLDAMLNEPLMKGLRLNKIGWQRAEMIMNLFNGDESDKSYIKSSLLSLIKKQESNDEITELSDDMAKKLLFELMYNSESEKFAYLSYHLIQQDKQSLDMRTKLFLNKVHRKLIKPNSQSSLFWKPRDTELKIKTVFDKLHKKRPK